MTGVIEETFHHVIIQSGIFNVLPKLILRTFSPAQTKLIDHTIAKISRVVLTAAVFALSHISFAKCISLAPQFTIGLYHSYLYETGTSLTELVTRHFLYDAVLASLMGGIPLKGKPMC